MISFRIKEILQIINGEVKGKADLDLMITGISGIETAGKNTLSFLHNLKYTQYLYQTEATAVLVSKDFTPSGESHPLLIHVEDVYRSLILLLEKFDLNSITRKGIEEPVCIAGQVEIKENVYIGAFTYIGARTSIGRNVNIYPNCYIGTDVTIGDDTILYAGVKVYSGCEIGNDCILHSGAVIGSDGFGHAPGNDGNYKKIPQIGKVIIHDHVEIGANTTIDRATMEATIIHSGVKLDNLIMIAHNVEIGENTVIAAQTGISGSTKIGKSCVIAGQVGFVGHIEIADGSKFGAKSGISQSIKEPDGKWFGVPLMPVNDALRVHGIIKKLPDIYKQINNQQKEIEELKKRIK